MRLLINNGLSCERISQIYPNIYWILSLLDYNYSINYQITSSMNFFLIMHYYIDQTE